MTDAEYKSCLEDIYKERSNILVNWSAPPVRLRVVDMPEFLDAAMAYMPGAHSVTGPMFQYSTVWGLEIYEHAATPELPQGIWIEDRDGIFHRVR